MTQKPTPTTHGAWRVIDGQLVDESAQVPPAATAIATPEPIQHTPSPLKGGTKTPSKSFKE